MSFNEVYNGGPELFQVRKGDRITQGVISPVAWSHFEFSDSFSETERGEGGFGRSTGVR